MQLSVLFPALFKSVPGSTVILRTFFPELIIVFPSMAGPNASAGHTAMLLQQPPDLRWWLQSTPYWSYPFLKTLLFYDTIPCLSKLHTLRHRTHVVISSNQQQVEEDVASRSQDRISSDSSTARIYSNLWCVASISCWHTFYASPHSFSRSTQNDNHVCFSIVPYHHQM